MNDQDKIQKHAADIDQQIANLVISTLRHTLAKASAEIEELKARILELESTPKPPA